jgi:hypothetical protein
MQSGDRERNMKKTTGVSIGIVILALGLFLLLNNAPDKNSSVIESEPSEREVSPDKLLTKHKSASKPTAPDDSSTSEDESQQLSQEEQDILMDEFIITFWEELGLADNASLEEKRLSLGIFDRPYMKTITEREFHQLSKEDQEKAIAEVMDTAKKTRMFVMDVIAEAKSCITNKDYTRAEACLMYGLEVGRELSANKEGLFITRLVGIACEKESLKELVNLYTQTGDDTGVQRSKEYLSQLDTEVEELREAAKQLEATN